MKIRLLRPIYFIWTVIPVILLLTYLSLGLPHMIWSYSWFDEGQGYDPFAHRTYTRCTFIGPYGAFTTHPNNGRCEWFRFFLKKQEDRT